MKTQTRILMLGAFAASLLTVTPTLPAQDARFFRISGPAASKILALQTDGTLIWSNALAGTNYTVQTVTSLPGGTNWVDYVQLPVTNSVNTNLVIDYHPAAGMALIPAGSFTMGDNLDGDPFAQPVHTVYVSAFSMDKCDVTEALWQQVYNWATNHGYSFENAGSMLDGVNYSKGANYPVDFINWYDCVKWCNARSELEGRVPAYYTDAALAVVYRTEGLGDISNSFVNWNAGYRLPTEAEWEKAARGGLSGQRFPWGNTITESQANYWAYPPTYGYDLGPYYGYNTNFDTGYYPFSYIDTGYPYTSPVNYFAPNGYGLYDMAGNVLQRCWDWYGSYGSGSQSDPRGPTVEGDHVLRGGVWNGSAYDSRCAYRISAA